MNKYVGISRKLSFLKLNNTDVLQLIFVEDNIDILRIIDVGKGDLFELYRWGERLLEVITVGNMRK